jgi:hypothetical protein
MRYSLSLGFLLSVGFIGGLSCMTPIAKNTNITDLEKIMKKEADKTGFVPLSAFFSFFDKIKLSDEAKKFLDKIQIADPVFLASPLGLTIKGSAKLNNLHISIDVQVVPVATGVPNIHVEFLLPKGAKPSDLMPKLSKLDFIEVESSGFIFSTYAYVEDESKIKVEPGITYKAAISLDTIIEKIRQAIDSKAQVDKNEFKKSMSKFFVTDKLAIYYSGYVSLTLDEIVGRMEIPLEFGLDFTALTRKKDGSKVFDDPLIRKITLSSIIAEVAIKKAELSGTLSLGVYVYPKTQEKPLEFQARGTIEQSGLKIGGLMKGSFDPAFGLDWLALGVADFPAGIELFFDNIISPAFIAVCGVPLPAGFTIAGGLGMGKGQYRTTAQGAISLELKTAGIPEFIFSGKVDQINLSRLIQLLASIGDKKLVIGDDIPQIVFKNMELTVAPFGGDILGVKYDAGIKAGAALQVGKFEAGGTLALGLTPQEPRLMVDAYIDNLEVKLPRCKIMPEGGLLFAVTGFGADKKLGTADDKARLKVDFAVGKPIDQQIFKVDAALKIPPLQFFGGLYCDFEGNKISGGGEGSFFDGKFTAKTDLSIDLTNPQDFSFSCLMHNDFTPYLCQEMVSGFEVFKKNALGDIAKYDQEIQEAQDDFSKLADKEKSRVADKIKNIKAQLKQLNPPAVGKLKPALAGGLNLYVSNHTDDTFYVAMYIVNKKTHNANLRGSVLKLAPHTKNQLARPALAQIAKYDRDMLISTEASDLKPVLTGDEYYSIQRKHVGGTYAQFHITQKGENVSVFTGPEWTGKYGDDILRLGLELSSFLTYQKLLLSPGAKTADKVLEAVQNLKALPVAFVKISEKVIPILVKSLQFVIIQEAGLSTAGKDLLAGKLPKVTLKLEINVDKKKILVDIVDMQLDIHDPLPFFVDVAQTVAVQLVPQFIAIKNPTVVRQQLKSDPDLDELLQDMDISL